jgi:hypothetical protein
MCHDGRSASAAGLFGRIDAALDNSEWESFNGGLMVYELHENIIHARPIALFIVICGLMCESKI